MDIVQDSGLIRRIAQRYLPLCDRATDIDDLMQAGAIGVLRAQETYDESKGKWTSWAGNYIQTEMQEALGLRGTRIRAHRQAISLDKPIAEDTTGTLQDTLLDPSADIEEQSDLAELQRAVRASVEALGVPVWRELVERCDLEGKTMAEAAKELGIDPKSARQAKYRAHRKLYRDAGLKALAEANGLTNWHLHRGLIAWKSDWMSATEILAFERIRDGL